MENINKSINDILKGKLQNNLISKIEGGINGCSYELNLDNKKFFLKKYPIDEVNKHNRIKSELSFLYFLKNNNFKNIPEIISFSKKDRWILYKWIKGSKIKNISKKEVQDLISFLINIQNLRNKENISILPVAAESCFSLKDHQKLIIFKLRNTLKKINYLFSLDSKLKIIVQNDFFKKIKLAENIHKEYSIYNKFWDYKLSNDEICISPSDIGFHNILKTVNGLIFFDFEFSGIDDPCKLIVDLILQPDHSIPKNYVYLINQLVEIFNNKNPFFKLRLKAIFDLYQIKWYCIIYNPLIKTKSRIEDEDLINFINKSNQYFRKIEKQKSKLLDQLEIN